jgi:hypothetical protein
VLTVESKAGYLSEQIQRKRTLGGGGHHTIVVRSRRP